MKLLLLAGNSLHNKEWIEEVERTLAPHFNQTLVHYYQHWSTGDELIDLEYELEQLTASIGDLAGWVVFAKSAGTILIIRGCYENKIKPLKCVFAGTAIGWAEAQGMNVHEWLKNYSIPTLFIQKTSDPAIGYLDLANLLNDVVNVTTKEIPGDNHSYEDLRVLESEVTQFLK